ncbi:MAG: FGGY family carbohydrate kinase, partial [Atribacterota bacterium]
MTFVIGCDLGTTATKTGLFDEKGNCLVVARKNSHIIYGKDGSVIQDPTEMLGTVVETIREVMEKSGVKPAEVLGIALDGQMAGVMGVDEKGEAATPYDSWLDIRSSGYADVMKQKAEDLIIRRSGMAPSINHGPKILWWKNEQPDVYRTIRAFTMPSCWIEQKLSGLSGEETYIDPTYLHFSCFADLVNNRWDPEIIGLFEIEEHKFPRIVEPWDIIGGVKKEWADQMGLLAGTPLVAGCGDQAANCLGAGVSEPGIAFDVAGTASCFCLFVDSYRADVKYKTILFPRAVLRDRYYPMAYINGGGMDLEWAKNELFRDVVSSPEAFSRMAEEIEKNAPSPSGVVFVPHLRGRNCPTQSHLRGVFAGFSWDHTRAQLYRAILEGIAFEYAYYVQVI